MSLPVSRNWSLVWFMAMLGVLANSAPAGVPAAAPGRANGYVYVIVPSRGDLRDPMPVAMHAIGKKDEFTFAPRTDAGVNAFGAWVPEGDYKLVAGPHYDVPSPGTTENVGYADFHVSAGRVTDLGTLLKIPVGERQIVVLPVRPAEYDGRVKDAIQEFRGTLSSGDPIEWSTEGLPHAMEPPTPYSPMGGIIVGVIKYYVDKANMAPAATGLRGASEIDQFLAAAKRTAPPLTARGEAGSEGTLYFGADLGQIRVRSPDGTWSSLDTGTVSPITAVMWDQGALYAGSDGGAIFKSVDLGASWTQAGAASGDERILSISHTENHWLVATGTKTTRSIYRALATMRVYASDRDLSELRVVKEAPLRNAIVEQITPHAVAANGGYYINPFPDLLRLDLNALQWSPRMPPGGVVAFSVTEKTGHITAFWPKGMFSKLYVSSDSGLSWQQRPTPPIGTVDVYFDENDIGTAVRWPALSSGSAWQILRLDPSKKDWEKIQEAPDGCKRVLYNPAHTQFACVTSGGSISALVDGKWHTEFTVE